MRCGSDGESRRRISDEMRDYFRRLRAAFTKCVIRNKEISHTS